MGVQGSKLWVQGSGFKVDMAAKRHKKHGNKFTGCLISMG
jgi:hypothetical protein